jgi:hypothetical protein
MEIDMLKQMKTKDTGLLGIMRSAPFVKGFSEARAGNPIRYDAYINNANSQWNYERGRLFGLIFSGPLKVGRSVNRGAAVQLAVAFHQKAIL